MFTAPYISTTVSLVAQTVKNRPAMQETVVLSLGQEDPLETRRATPVLFPGECQGQKSKAGYSMGSQRVKTRLSN